MLEANEKLAREMTKALCDVLIEGLQKLLSPKRPRRRGPPKLDTESTKVRFSICSDK